MAASKNEHRDAYIAAGIAGVVIILIMLYLFGGSQASASTLPAADATASPDQTPYNYNVAPYQPGPPIAVPPRNLNLGGGGCCDTCGTDQGGAYINPGVNQFLTLLGGGGG